MFINYYEILGIEIDATEEQIKKAYRLNAIKYHPDKNFGDPYFTKTFIAIKDAYDNLIDPQKRAEFDIIYKQRFAKTATSSNDTYQEQQTKQEYQRQEQYERQQRTEQRKKEEEKFRYDPHKQFYSDYDRELQETPQFNPIYNIWGDKLPEGLEFFKLPKKIGKIISGFSDLVLNTQPLSNGQKTKRILIGALIGLAIGTAIYFIASLTNPIWIAIWFIVPTAIMIWAKDAGNKFKHTNLYVGVNGFAEFVCEDSRDNIVTATEVNFNEVTDVYLYQVDYSRNYVYQHTKYIYVWLDRPTGKVRYAKEGEYNKKTEIKQQPFLLNFYRTTEKYWTVYLLDRLEETLQKQGYVLFCLYSHEKNLYQEYIKLGIGKITFIKGKGEEFTYKFNEIKKMYTKGSELRIQHKNFERTLYFFKSGNEDVIPLTNLCNRQFFLRAIEILLGYSIG
jgi:curved DNA-binding protein CbpA